MWGKLLALSFWLLQDPVVAGSLDVLGDRSCEGCDPMEQGVPLEGLDVAGTRTEVGDAGGTTNDPLKRNIYHTFLEDKVYDVILVTDNYGLNDKLALDEDSVVLKAFEKLGRKVHRASIQDETFDWETGKAVIMRSAWTKYWYLKRYHEFMDTIHTHAFMFNPPALVHWQSDKIQYMKQLAHFVKLPQTLIVRKDVAEIPPYEQLAKALNCSDIIIKPAGGNSGHGVKLITSESDQDYYEDVMEENLWEDGQDVLVQCYMYSVSHHGIGEISVYIVDGKVTHAGYSIPAEDHYLIHEEYGGWGDDHNATAVEQKFAMDVYHAASTITGVKPLYFRVDMMYDNDGDVTLMEIACGTTDMIFRDFPAAADVMAAAVDRMLSEKEAEYEQIHGHKPELIDMEEYQENNEEEEFDSFGTPLTDGSFGREKPWLKTLNRTLLSLEELSKISPYHKMLLEQKQEEQQAESEEEQQEEQQAESGDEL